MSETARMFSPEFLAEAAALFKRLEAAGVNDDDVLEAMESSGCAEVCESATKPRAVRRTSPWLLLIGGVGVGGVGSGLTISAGGQTVSVAPVEQVAPVADECPAAAEIMVCQELTQTLETAIRGIAYSCRPAVLEPSE